MKKLIVIIVFAFTAVLQAQTEGINYQAVILNPDAQPIPGPDSTGNVLIETEIALRFTILNEDGSVVYQEVLETATDIYGMVNVFIGSGEASPVSNFTDINWNGTPHNLAVELDIKQGRGFVFLSMESLTFIPQAYHRNIIADGDLTVQGTATFNSNFVIEGQTIINSDLDVTGDLNVGEDLIVDEDLNVGEDLNVDGNSIIDKDLSVGRDLEVGDDTVIGDQLTVNGRTDINGSFLVNNESVSILSGRLEVAKRAEIGESLTVGAGASIGGSVFTEGDFRALGNQIIEGDSRIDGDSRVEGSQIVVTGQQINGNQTVLGNTNVEGHSFVDGAVQVGSSLNVAGEGIFNARVTVVGETNLLDDLNVDGDTTLNDDAIINGDVEIQDFLTVGQGGSYGGNLDVFGKATVSQSFTVVGATSLESTVKVTNQSPVFLSGALQVEGRSVLKNSLEVTDAASTTLSGTLDVGKDASFGDDVIIGGILTVSNSLAPTTLNGTLDVGQDAFFGDDVVIDGMLTVNNNLALNGLTVSGSNNSNHIAVFENSGTGGADGIAIQIDTPQLDSDNRFVTFYGQDDHVAGKIESYNAPGVAQGGVVYGSTGADYAEWLEKENPSETYKVGEVVGVKGGKISYVTEGADHVLTISMAPIVLGNMPDEKRKQDFEKVGFMGQVPALVKGKVNKGDYIMASGKNDGYAIAVAPEDIQLEHLKRVIGKAWSSSQNDGTALINVSVGLKSHEWVRILETQEKRIQTLETQLKSFENLSERLKKMESKIDALDMN